MWGRSIACRLHDLVEVQLPGGLPLQGEPPTKEREDAIPEDKLFDAKNDAQTVSNVGELFSVVVSVFTKFLDDEGNIHADDLPLLDITKRMIIPNTYYEHLANLDRIPIATDPLPQEVIHKFLFVVFTKQLAKCFGFSARIPVASMFQNVDAVWQLESTYLDSLAPLIEDVAAQMLEDLIKFDKETHKPVPVINKLQLEQRLLNLFSVCYQTTTPYIHHLKAKQQVMGRESQLTFVYLMLRAVTDILAKKANTLPDGPWGSRYFGL